MVVGGGFVDVLRLGEGVRSGTVGGVAQDGLRLLSVAAPAFRGLRLSAGVLPRLIGPVTETAATANLDACAWVAAVNALRMTGARHFATIAQMLDAAGIGFAEAGQGVRSLRPLVQPMARLGARPVLVPGATSLGELRTLLETQPQRGVAIFGVGWSNAATGRSAGHMMVAFLEGGELRILDRTGRVVRTLEELESVSPRYQGIGSTPDAVNYMGPAAIGPPGTLPNLGWDPEVMVIPNSVPLPSLPRVGTILNQVGFEAQTVMLMTRDQADARLRTLRRRRSAIRLGPATPLERPMERPVNLRVGLRRDGESPF
jgi:hypothetical protein